MRALMIVAGRAIGSVLRVHFFLPHFVLLQAYLQLQRSLVAQVLDNVSHASDPK